MELSKYKIMNHLVARLVSHQSEPNDIIVYCLQATDLRTNRSKVAKLRYREFLALHQELQNLVSKFKIDVVLPSFPRRKVVGSTNKSETSVLNRKKQLNQYLEALICIEQLYCLEIFKRYFIPSNPTSRFHENYHQHLNIHFSIDRYCMVEDVVVYWVRLRDLDEREEWAFQTRYSQLRNVHTALQASIRYLPPFPKKKIFGITNDSPEDIEKRRIELEKYFNQIFSTREILQSDAIAYFIEVSKKLAKEAPTKKP